MANHRALKNSGGKNSRRLRILLVTPEISFIPRNMGKIATILQVKGGGLADISSALVNELFSRDMDIHVAIPHYRRIFKLDTKQMSQRDLHFYYLNYSAAEKGDESRIHFAEDRCFYYQDQVYDQSSGSVIHFALAFQRETMNHIIRKVRPDIVHCNDWTTGLIPGFTRRLGMRSLLTVHPLTVETHDTGLSLAERYGFSVYDAMIAAAALHAGCDTLLSEDLQHGMALDEGLRIVNPFQAAG